MDYPLYEYEMLANDIEYSLANNNSDNLSDRDPDRIRQLLAAYLAAEKQHAELLAALKTIDDGDVDNIDDAIMVAREAIAKAGGKS